MRLEDAERNIADNGGCTKVYGMTLTVTIPDVLAAALQRVQPALPQVLLDGFAVEA